MKTIVEAFVDALLGAVMFFADLSVSRYDDPIVAGFKRRKAACVASTGILAIIVALGVFIASQLDSLAASPTFGAMAEGGRAPVGYAFLAALICAALYAGYSYFSLWRFMQDGGGVDA